MGRAYCGIMGHFSGRLRSSLEGGLRSLGTVTISHWLRRHDGDLARMRRFLPRISDGARSQRQFSHDRIADKAHLSACSDEENPREEIGLGERLDDLQASPTSSDLTRMQDASDADDPSQWEDCG